MAVTKIGTPGAHKRRQSRRLASLGPTGDDSHEDWLAGGANGDDSHENRHAKVPTVTTVTKIGRGAPTVTTVTRTGKPRGHKRQQSRGLAPNHLRPTPPSGLPRQPRPLPLNLPCVSQSACMSPLEKFGPLERKAERLPNVGEELGDDVGLDLGGALPHEDWQAEDPEAPAVTRIGKPGGGNLTTVTRIWKPGHQR